MKSSLQALALIALTIASALTACDGGGGVGPDSFDPIAIVDPQEETEEIEAKTPVEKEEIDHDMDPQEDYQIPVDRFHESGNFDSGLDLEHAVDYGREPSEDLGLDRSDGSDQRATINFGN